MSIQTNDDFSIVEDSSSGYVVPKDTCDHLEEHCQIETIKSVNQTCGLW